MLFILFYLVSSFAPAPTAGTTDWKLSHNAEGITIYTRNDGDGQKEFKATTLVNTNVKNCVGIMDDIHLHEKFMFRVYEGERISRLSNEITYTYYRVDMPWPLDDRDIVSKVHFALDEDGTATYSMYATPDEIPQKEGVVRIEDAEGLWRFRPMANDQVEITYQYKSDPIGIPAWVVNLFILSAPKETLSSMRDLMPKVNYSEKTYPWYR